MRKVFPAAPPSARKVSSRNGRASTTSRVWNAAASSAALTTCSRRVPPEIPLIKPRAPGSQCGAPQTFKVTSAITITGPGVDGPEGVTAAPMLAWTAYPSTGSYKQTTNGNQAGQTFGVSFTCVDSGTP